MLGEDKVLASVDVLAGDEGENFDEVGEEKDFLECKVLYCTIIKISGSYYQMPLIPSFHWRLPPVNGTSLGDLPLSRFSKSRNGANSRFAASS